MTDQRVRADHVVAALGTFVGMIFAARVTALTWLKWADEFSEVAKWGLRLAGSEILIVLRQFEDIWKAHVADLLPIDHISYRRGKALVGEISRRRLRDTANRLAAHYAKNPADLPLGDPDIHDLITANGFATSQEFIIWAGEAMWQIYEVRKALLTHYSFPPEVDMGTVMSVFLERFIKNEKERKT